MLAIEVRINTHSKFNNAKNINILEKKHGGRIRTCYDLGDEKWNHLFFRNNPPSRIVNSGYHGGVQSAGETMEVDTDTHLIRVKTYACFIRHGMIE